MSLKKTVRALVKIHCFTWQDETGFHTVRRGHADVPAENPQVKRAIQKGWVKVEELKGSKAEEPKGSKAEPESQTGLTGKTSQTSQGKAGKGQTESGGK